MVLGARAKKKRLLVKQSEDWRDMGFEFGGMDANFGD